MLVDGLHHGRKDQGEGDGGAGGLLDLLGVEEVDAAGGAHGPVVVLARAVDVGEGLLLEEAGEVVARGDLLAQLHDDQVLVHLLRHAAKVRGHLVLVGGNLPVARLERDAEAEGLLLDVLDAVLRVGVEGREVVVAHLLAARLPTHTHTERVIRMWLHVLPLRCL